MQLGRLGRNPLTAKRLNSLLADDVSVLKIYIAPAGFDARFSAIGRSYQYSISDALSKPNPKLVRYTLQVNKSLSVEKMNQAAAKLIGLRDFGAFCKPRPGATTIRELRRLEVRRVRGRILVDVSADAFCHNMVRALVGALIAVGEGKLTASELSAIQKKAARTSSFKVVGSKGLTLMAISYPAVSGLAKQAEKARNIRSFEEISV
jgi:tRNA pseudouridine38-40 synthase